MNPNVARWSDQESGMPWNRSRMVRGRGWRPSTLPSRSRLHYAVERPDDQWAASAWQRFVSHPPESAPAEACLKREACLRCYGFWFGSAMTYCPQKAGEHFERARAPPDNGIAIRYDPSCATGQGTVSHGCHRIAQNLSSRCPRAQLRRRRGKMHARKTSLSSE
jgi:hypothetical protein